MQKARVRFNEKTILNDGLIAAKTLASANDDDEIYFAFFDDATVALYSSRSRFLTKIKTDELERLIENGCIHVMP